MNPGALLEAVGLRASYPARGLSGRGRRVVALDGVDLAVSAGEALGIVGGSGAGKSTLARLLLALEPPEAGVVRFAGHELTAMTEREIRPLRRRFQPVFQDPLAALDPRMRVAAAVREPLDANRIGAARDRPHRVRDLLELVGLAGDLGRRYPGALSGGERQRVAIARALAPAPELLVLDEPVSSLDVAVQVQILDLLADLRARLGLTLVLISHDLGVVREVCDRVAVMERGRIVEQGTTSDVLDRPEHPHTKALLEASPAKLTTLSS